MNIRIHPFEGYSGNILRHTRFERVLQNAVSTSIQNAFIKNLPQVNVREARHLIHVV